MTTDTVAPPMVSDTDKATLRETKIVFVLGGPGSGKGTQVGRGLACGKGGQHAPHLV